jgi:hypothetical protein
MLASSLAVEIQASGFFCSHLTIPYFLAAGLRRCNGGVAGLPWFSARIMPIRASIGRRLIRLVFDNEQNETARGTAAVLW